MSQKTFLKKVLTIFFHVFSKKLLLKSGETHASAAVFIRNYDVILRQDKIFIEKKTFASKNFSVRSLELFDSTQSLNSGKTNFAGMNNFQ